MKLLVAMERALKGVQRRVLLAPVISFIPRDKEWEEACGEVHAFLDGFIDRALARKHERCLSRCASSKAEEKGTIYESVLEAFVEVSDDGQFIRDQLLSLFIPFHNAGPIGISDLFFQLARSPAEWTKLRQEVIAAGDVTLTFELLKSMRYLQCVVRESEYSCFFQSGKYEYG